MRACWRLLLALCLAALGAVGVAVPGATAANWVVGAEPGIRQVTTVAPGRVTVAFSRALFNQDPRLYVLNAAGDQVSVGAVNVEGATISVLVQSGLPKGTYTVEFKVAFSEGDARGGTFQFAYGTANWTKKTSYWVGEDAEPEIHKGENPDRPKRTDEPTVAPSEPAESPTASTPAATPESTPTPTPSAQPSPSASPQSGGSSTAWLIGAIFVVAALGGAGVMLWLRRRNA